MDVREAFEKWASSDESWGAIPHGAQWAHYGTSICGVDGRYWNRDVQAAWESWQAGAAWAARECERIAESKAAQGWPHALASDVAEAIRAADELRAP